MLRDPSPAAERVIELTGPTATDLHGLAAEYAAALGRPVRYEDVRFDAWDAELRRLALPEHVHAHILTMAKLHAAGRYDRLTRSVEAVLGRPATPLRKTLTDERASFER